MVYRLYIYSSWGLKNQFTTFGGTTLYHCHYSYHQSSPSENFHMAENNPFIDEWPIFSCDYFSHVYGYGSIPINTIFRGMNIHLPAILGFTRYQGFDPSPYVVLPEDLIVIIFFFDWCSPKCHLELREIDHLKPELDKRWILPRGAQKAVPIHDIPIISQEIIIIIIYIYSYRCRNFHSLFFSHEVFPSYEFLAIFPSCFG